MSGILSGLGDLGLDNIENLQLYEKEDSAEKVSAIVQNNVITEKDLIYDKTFTCPVCDSKFQAKIMKTGKAKLLRTDIDLRPAYENIDSTKYDVELCPFCGYAALSRYFTIITNNQAKAIRENISQRIKLKSYQEEVYSYDQAFERYKIALACAIVKQAKASEKAYICLKTAWLIRGMAEESNKNLEAQELEYLKNAFDGFLTARQSEGFPICGMDEVTMDYLIAVLGYKLGNLEVASKLIATILTSSTANNRTKDKTRELKELVINKLKKV